VQTASLGPSRIRRVSLGQSIAVVGVLATGFFAQSVRAEYTYTSIADSNGSYNVFNSFSPLAGPFGTASVSDNGTVAFWATLDAGGEGIFYGIGGAVTTAADTSAGPAGGFSNLGENPSISSTGVIGFSGTPTGGSNSVYSRNTAGGSVNPVAAPGGIVASIPNNPTYNANNQAAFRAFRTGGGEGIYRAGTGGLVEIVFGDNVPGGSDFDTFATTPGINSSGMVAFQARYFGAANSGVFIGNGTGGVTTIADSFGSTFSNSFGSPDINDSGSVVFRAGLDAGGSGIFLATGTTITTVIDSSGIFSSFGTGDINNDGLIAYSATLDAGGTGIYLGDGTRVIGTGDALFGSTVTNVGFAHGLNNDGNIAFVYRLANGTQGVALAVPEPGSAAALLVTAGVLAMRRRRAG